VAAAPGDGSRAAVARMFGRGSLYTIAQAAQLSAALLVIPALTRLVEPEELGVIALAVLVQSILGVVSAAGLPVSIGRNYFRPEYGPARAAALIPAAGLVAVCVATVAELTGPLWSGVFADVDYGGALRVAVWSSVPLALLGAAQSHLRAAERAGMFVTTAMLAAPAAQLAGVLVLVLADSDATGYFAGVAALQAVAALVALGSIAEARRLGSLVDFRRSLAVGLPTIVHSLALYALAAGDRGVIERLEGLDAVGRFQVAYALGAIVLSLLFAINFAWSPIVYGSPEERRWQVLAETREPLFGVAGLAVAVIAIGAPVGLAVAAPGSYSPEELVPVTSIVALSGIPMVLYLSHAHAIIWHGKTIALAFATPTAAALNIVLCLVLIPPLGLEGAALATVIGYCVLALLTLPVARRLTGLALPGRTAVLSAVGATAAVGVSLLVPVDGVWLVPRTVVAVGLVVVLGLAVRGHIRSGSSPQPVGG
jgi:O-antigen/teichoic acid export membrane protein